MKIYDELIEDLIKKTMYVSVNPDGIARRIEKSTFDELKLHYDKEYGACYLNLQYNKWTIYHPIYTGLPAGFKPPPAT